MPSDQADPAVQVTRLKRQLRDARADLKRARAELALRPPAADAGDLTPDEIRHLHALFTPSEPGGPACAACGKLHTGPCQTCGGIHARECPRVRSVEFTSQGDRVLIRKVTYWPEGRWSTDGIMFADELPPLPGED